MRYSSSYYSDSGILATLGIWLVIILAFAVFMIICSWRILQKAGEPGWSILIPVYGSYKMAVVAFGEGGQFWLYFVVTVACQMIASFFPQAAVFFSIVVVAASLLYGVPYCINMARSFGKTGGFAAGLIFLPFIFFPILAFSDAKHCKGSYAEPFKGYYGANTDEQAVDADTECAGEPLQASADAEERFMPRALVWWIVGLVLAVVSLILNYLSFGRDIAQAVSMLGRMFSRVPLEALAMALVCLLPILALTFTYFRKKIGAMVCGSAYFILLIVELIVYKPFWRVLSLDRFMLYQCPIIVQVFLGALLVTVVLLDLLKKYTARRGMSFALLSVASVLFIWALIKVLSGSFFFNYAHISNGYMVVTAARINVSLFRISSLVGTLPIIIGSIPLVLGRKA